VTTKRARELIDDEIRLAVLFEVPVALGVALRRRGLDRDRRQGLPDVAGSDHRSRGDRRDPYSWLMRTARSGSGTPVSPASAPRRHERNLVIGLDLAHRCGALGPGDGASPRTSRRRGPTATARGHRTRVIDPDRGFGGHVWRRRDCQTVRSPIRVFITRNTVAWHLRNVYRKAPDRLAARATAGAPGAPEPPPPETE